MSHVRIAINGFGRIGRAFFKTVLGQTQDKLDIVAVNDLADLEQLAYLLKYDSVYGRWDKKVEIEPGNLVIDGQKVKFLQEEEPAKLPWRDLKVDIVLESTGVFESFEKAKIHLDAGAKRAIISEIGRAHV